jgi:ribosomal protein S18 acetylase RimI-like enzyme
MNIEFEKAKSSDYKEIHAVMHASAREISRKSYHEEVRKIFDKFYNDRTSDYIKQTLENPNNLTLLAKSDNRIIGYIQLENHNTIGTINHFYILPGFEGNSIGTQLFNLIKKEAIRMKIDKLLVESTLNALCYYERLGFVNKGLIDDCSAYNLEMELNRV